ncbi:aspartate/glutamate racemase family protein [bacterium]|nr:aspartate/glutamate racemase family protein [bacterium]
MRLMITDSGLGGLSVCAGLEQALQESGVGAGVELLYVNAAPHDRNGYNALKTQAERIALFDRFLIAANTKFSPAEMAIACNTLSVIYYETDFARQSPPKVTGIVETGVKLCKERLADKPDHDLIIFATETTTEANTYPRLINAPPSQLVAQPCPELAHAISNDATGAACRNLLRDYIEEALACFDHKPHSLFAFLGCTHYGYQANIFRDLLIDHGISTTILNPNQLLVEHLSARITESDSSPEPLNIRFISRYPIPKGEIESMEYYLKDSAPLTLKALNQQEVHPDLF